LEKKERMIKRFINLVKSWFGHAIETLESPTLLLQQAQEDMQKLHRENRERAVRAITAKNNLQQQVSEMERKVNDLGAKAELALKRGQRDIALQLLKEKQSYQGSLDGLQSSLQQAIETSEAVKEHIRREGDKIREKMAQATALKVEWENARIQQEIAKQLDGLESIDGMDTNFERARTKIKNTMSEASARQELNKTNVSAKLLALEDIEHNANAEQELAQMEAKLGLGVASPAMTPVVIAGESDLERQLAELEAKVGTNSNTLVASGRG
jgi:phage shock protein A